jgi:hypothetical protein
MHSLFKPIVSCIEELLYELDSHRARWVDWHGYGHMLESCSPHIYVSWGETMITQYKNIVRATCCSSVPLLELKMSHVITRWIINTEWKRGAQNISDILTDVFIYLLKNSSPLADAYSRATFLMINREAGQLFNPSADRPWKTGFSASWMLLAMWSGRRNYWPFACLMCFGSTSVLPPPAPSGAGSLKPQHNVFPLMIGGQIQMIEWVAQFKKG